MHVSFHHVLRYKMKLQCTCMIVLGEVVRYRGRKEERKTVAINDTDLSGDARKEVGQKGRGICEGTHTPCPEREVWPLSVWRHVMGEELKENL